MKTSDWFTFTLLSATFCVLAKYSNAVVPRRSRHRPRMPKFEVVDMRAAAKFRMPSTTPLPILDDMKFRPSVIRCCKVGEKTARKQLSCNLDTHAVVRKNNLVHKAKLKLHGTTTVGKSYAKLLAQRISKCASSKFSANLEKCCRYREDYYKELSQCKPLRGAQRKQCRKDIKRKYP